MAIPTTHNLITSPNFAELNLKLHLFIYIAGYIGSRIIVMKSIHIYMWKCVFQVDQIGFVGLSVMLIAASVPQNDRT